MANNLRQFCGVLVGGTRRATNHPSLGMVCACLVSVACADGAVSNDSMQDKGKGDNIVKRGAVKVEGGEGDAPVPFSVKWGEENRGRCSHVIFRDPIALASKRQRIVNEGVDNLQVIADFDYTMTKFWVNGRRGASCHGVIEECGLLSPEYHVQATALKNHYYPLEVDPTLGHEQRVELMVEWVSRAHVAMLSAGLTHDKIVTAVAGANVALREGHGRLFNILQKEGIPLLLFSAGLADVLEEVLRQRAESPVPRTSHVISNRMEFSQDGSLSGFSGKLFHVFNKHAAAVMDEPFFSGDEVRRRGNVLLLGDSLGDLNMARGLGSREVLAIGFLNDKVEERLEKYLAAYDVVIVGDGGLGFVVDLLEELSARPLTAPPPAVPVGNT